VRTVRELVTLAAVSGYAVYSDTGLSTASPVTVKGFTANTANVYTNGGYTCSSGGKVDGSVYAQGLISLQTGCEVLVDAWSQGNLTANGAVVGDNATSSAGSITLGAGTRVGNDAIAATGCNGAGCSTAVSLKNDLALVSDGPISTGVNTAFSSGDGNVHNLYLIVPSGTACGGGSGPNISLGANTTFTNINVMVFTPCLASMGSISTYAGELYAGTVSFGSTFGMTYRPMTVPGMTQVSGFVPGVKWLREDVA
jgi:hypothetical protein